MKVIALIIVLLFGVVGLVLLLANWTILESGADAASTAALGANYAGWADVSSAYPWLALTFLIFIIGALCWKVIKG